MNTEDDDANSGPLLVSFDTAIAGLDDDRVRLLGGKAANLIEMRQRLGLRVPPGFVLTTRACRRYLDGDWGPTDDKSVADELATVEGSVDRRFGATERPLLVSVRSGAPRSMPGMLDTILNVGINESVAAALAAETGDRDFADNTWLRFTRMFAEIVLGVPTHLVAEAAHGATTLTAIEAVRSLADSYGGIPDDPFEQLRQAIGSVFGSWNGDRAVAFRAREGIDETMGTACTIQAMVFGNLNDRSGTGVVFSRDPATGRRVLYGDYLIRAQGEDVVAGTANAASIALLGEQNAAAYAELQVATDRLERHFRDVCDIEFTVMDDTLYLLQTRIGRRSPLAAVVVAVDMAEDPDFPLAAEEAVGRVTPEQIEALRRARAIKEGAVAAGAGIGASPGVVAGVVETDLDIAIDRAERGESVVLVRNETSPADVRAMMTSVGIVTCIGGVGSHAAVVARGWGIPAVVGCGSVEIANEGVTLAGRPVRAGETITIDGATGAIYIGDQTIEASTASAALERLEQWRAELGASKQNPTDQSTGENTGAGDGASGSTGAGDGASENTGAGDGASHSTGASHGASHSTGAGDGASGSTGAGDGASGSTGAGDGASGSTGAGDGASGSTGAGDGASENTGAGDGRPERTDADVHLRATPLAVMRVVQFKGMATTDTIAAILTIPQGAVDDVVASLPADAVKETAMGLMLTPTGRAWLDDALAAEKTEALIAELAEPYRRFVPINAAFKEAITRWQTSGQDDAAFEALFLTLDEIHAGVGPIVDQTAAHAPRLGRFRGRLDEALEQVRDGDRTMIASPLADSYHTVWFEFHEELIHLAGRNRLDEETNATNET